MKITLKCPSLDELLQLEEACAAAGTCTYLLLLAYSVCCDGLRLVRVRVRVRVRARVRVRVRVRWRRRAPPQVRVSWQLAHTYSY